MALALNAPVADCAIILPLTFDGGNVYVAARIDDTPLRLIVDTGGKGGLQLTAATLSKVHVAMSPETETRTDALGHQYQGFRFEVDELVVDDATFRSVAGFVRGEADGGITGGLPADGLLGMEFLRPYVARFDYGSSTLTLFHANEEKAVAAACTGHQVPVFEHPLRFWSSEMSTDHGPLRLVWDSGATYSMIAAESARARSMPILDDLYQTVTLKSGGSEFGPLDFVVLDLHVPGVDALLGYNFFQRHIICFDGPRSAVIIVS